jgi:hypothetical protein
MSVSNDALSLNGGIMEKTRFGAQTEIFSFAVKL